MFAKYFPNKKRFQQTRLALVIIVVALVGTWLLLRTHAATPYASITADTGTLAGGATKQTCSGASNAGQCVLFVAPASGGGSSMIVGLDAGGWGTSGANDVATAVQYTRLDSANDEPISDFTGIGVKVDVDFSGPYEIDTGVSMAHINDNNAWVNSTLAYYKTNCTTSGCPIIEVLNEPGGTWFWGSNALSQANATAYANLVKATYVAFHNAYGASAPKILASFDGSDGSVPSGLLSNQIFGYEWWNSSMSPYVDGIVVHPYGGDSVDTTNAATTKAGFEASAAGNRADVEDAHTYTNKPIYVTEVGWPTDDTGPTATTANETGDSIQWPLADSAGNQYPGLDQCDNVYNFISWARSTGYVNSVMIYGYISNITGDTGSEDQYGLETYNNGVITKKPAWQALHAAAQNQANPCPKA